MSQASKVRQTHEIRLVVSRKGNRYTARWIEPNNQESESFRLTLPLTAEDTADLRWYLETYHQFPGAGDLVRAEGIETRLTIWGHRLFKAIFGTTDGTHVYRNLRAAAADGQRCLLTIGATDPDVLAQPWEMMRNKRAPLAFQGVTIRRQLRGSGTPRDFHLTLPVRVLLIVSRPTDIGFIDPRNSIAPMLDALAALPASQVTVHFCEPPTLAQLEQTISQARRNQQPYHIVHFDGHGTYLPRTGVGALAFERDDATTHLVTGTEFGDLLARLDVPLVLLEACRSSDLSDRPVFGSVAPALLESGVGSVVAFSHAVHIKAARLLVERFYKELAAQMSVGQALEEARTALRADPARWLHLGPNPKTIDLRDWFIPQLYQVGQDPVLFAPQSPAASNPITRLRMTVDLETEAFDQTRQRLLKYGVAGFLEISPDSVQLAAIEEGSVKVTIELPARSAKKLLRAQRANNQDLARHLSPLRLLDVSEERADRGRVFFNLPPPPIYRFHGRAMELLELERAFRRHPAVLLSGMGGMGKTALAREAAHWWLRKGRFDAAVFCSFEQRAGADRVVQLIGQALEGDQFSSRSAEDQWTTAVDLFRRRRVLLVWDNFESTLPVYQRGEATADGSRVSESALSFGDEARARLLQLYRELIADSPVGRLLITCRPAETGLPGIKEMPLGGLARPDSLHLLAAVLDIKGISTDRPGYGRREIDELLKTLSDHPLSIELVAPHLKELTPAQIRAEFGQLLERFADERAHEGRNRSLLASLAFSTKRLSEAAQKVLPYLAWFEGGVFERSLLAFAELDPEAWAAIRAELVATALVSVEDFEVFNTPYLRLHPTLPYAARPTDVRDPQAAEKRFIAVYMAVMKMTDDALRGSQPGAAMALLAHEEANFRTGITRAFRRGDRHGGWAMADTLRGYLERAGRLRERDALVKWVRDQLPEGDRLDDTTCAAIRQHAWSRLTQGHAPEAVQMVDTLLTRLETEGLAGGEDPTFQFALSYGYLGRMHCAASRPDLALGPLQKAIDLFEQLGDAQRGNLAAALGDLANTHRALGQYDTALEAAERGLTIDRDLGHHRGIAGSLGRIAAILTEQQRYAEADARYGEAFHAAEATGDLELQGILLQHQGGLQDEIGNHNRAVDLYRQAITFSQRANDGASEMQTCDLLASAERQLGHLDAADAWYARSRELATQLDDRHHYVGVARNLGILHQTRAGQATDEATRQSYLHQAVASVKESLDGFIGLNDQVNTAGSYAQLGVLYRMLGELEQAEEHTQQALRIRESLDLPDVYKDYANLAEIARQRGDTQAAARWQAKCDAKVEELKRLRQGEGAGGEAGRLPEQLVKGILALARDAYAARTSSTPLRPEAAEALAHLAELPAPLGAVGAFLKAVAEGQSLPPLPGDLPANLREILDKLVEALQKQSTTGPEADA